MTQQIAEKIEDTVIQWTRIFKEPENYGKYLVKGNGLSMTFARFGHPNGCRETGWYIENDLNESNWEQIFPHYWSEIPN